MDNLEVLKKLVGVTVLSVELDNVSTPYKVEITTDTEIIVIGVNDFDVLYIDTKTLDGTWSR